MTKYIFFGGGGRGVGVEGHTKRCSNALFYFDFFLLSFCRYQLLLHFILNILIIMCLISDLKRRMVR